MRRGWSCELRTTEEYHFDYVASEAFRGLLSCVASQSLTLYLSLSRALSLRSSLGFRVNRLPFAIVRMT